MTRFPCPAPGFRSHRGAFIRAPCAYKPRAQASPLAQARGMTPAIQDRPGGPTTNGVDRVIPPARAGGLLYEPRAHTSPVRIRAPCAYEPRAHTSPVRMQAPCAYKPPCASKGDDACHSRPPWRPDDQRRGSRHPPGSRRGAFMERVCRTPLPSCLRFGFQRRSIGTGHPEQPNEGQWERQYVPAAGRPSRIAAASPTPSRLQPISR